jgi:hypothetical protein
MCWTTYTFKIGDKAFLDETKVTIMEKVEFNNKPAYRVGWYNTDGSYIMYTVLQESLDEIP